MSQMGHNILFSSPNTIRTDNYSFHGWLSVKFCCCELVRSHDFMVLHHASVVKSRYNTPVSSIHIIYASGSGHTEYVVGEVAKLLSGVDVTITRAEQATKNDFLKGDILLLASGSWNTGGAEGQLNPYMDELLKKKAAGIDLAGKKVLLIGLGDSRYRYTVGCMRYLLEFVQTHNGVVMEPTLKIINEPYGQEQAIEEWISDIRSQISVS